MKQAFYILIVCFLLTSCASGSGSSFSGERDWTIFRGSPSLSGYTDTELPDDPVLLWTYKGDGQTKSSPVVSNGTTYWSDNRGHIRGIDLQGQPAFDYDLQTAVEATPMISDSTLYIGRIDGLMTALSLAQKDTLWNYETLGQVSASPNRLTFAGRQAIVFGSYDNYFYCVDAQSGKELRHFESGYYLNGAAALWKGHVIFGGCDSWIRIIDCATGVQTDSLLLDAYVPASPAVAGNDCYVGDYSGSIYKLVLDGGKIISHNKIVTGDSEGGSFVSVPAISDEACYFLSGERNLRAINRKDGSLLWDYLLKGATGESSPVVCDNKVLVCTKTGIISILDTDSGQLLWEYDAGEQIIASPAVIEDHFMVLTTKGTLLCFGMTP